MEKEALHKGKVVLQAIPFALITAHLGELPNKNIVSGHKNYK
ncbi:hypothetical protein R7007_03265 [Vibrio sp. 1636]|nr:MULTISPECIES: hypothetical protein [Vibrio]MDW2200675.1 hypothetical protein [Vibrio sp. 1636]